MLDNVKPCLKVHTGIAALAQDKSLAEINDTPNERISDSQGAMINVVIILFVSVFIYNLYIDVWSFVKFLMGWS